MPSASISLKQLASVSAGFAPKVQGLAGTCVILQLADFTDEGALLPDSLRVRIPLDEVPHQHRLQTGDVLLAAKGARLLATHVEPDWLPAAAATTFLVLRVSTPDDCLPAFLALWLNQPATRVILQSRLSATSVPTLNKRDVLDLPLPGILPQLAEQRRLLELNQLRLQEKQFALRLIRAREMEFQALFASHTSTF
jgi:hypothetical protein